MGVQEERPNGRERMWSTDLHELYQRISHDDSFQSELPDVSVMWAQRYGETDGETIRFDRASVKFEERLMETMRHEMAGSLFRPRLARLSDRYCFQFFKNRVNQ